MNLLIVAPFFPLPLESGGHTRVFNLVRHLSRRHTVDFVSFIHRCQTGYVGRLEACCRNVVCVNIDDIVDSCRTIVGANDFRRLLLRLGFLLRGVPLESSAFYYSQMREVLDTVLARTHYDVVEIEYPRMALNLRPSFFDDSQTAKVLVDLDLTYVPKWRRYQNERRLFARLANYIDYRIQKSFAQAMWKRFDCVVTMSEVDKNTVLSVQPALSVHVVPNGVDPDSFKPVAREKTPLRLLLLGGAGHPPNVDAFRCAASEIFPQVKAQRADVTLTVIGAGWERIRDRWADPSVVFPGFVEDLRSCATGACFLLVPLREGGGTRLKILEAMALGIPVVSTAIGCEGIAVEHKKHVWVAQTPEEFTQAILTLDADPQLCRQLIVSARELVCREYGWADCALKCEAVYGAARGRSDSTLRCCSNH